MSRHFKKDEFDMIYKIYNEFGLKKTINYINDISPDTGVFIILCFKFLWIFQIEM
ncbi:hypothetical protein [Mesomycoplasma ovipneumoniae]|uniref:hypothetical protein n=1 Tax=Mesomycoplasma ovipneumoniae TaxID=29562 RepID=UPI003080064F